MARYGINSVFVAAYLVIMEFPHWYTRQRISLCVTLAGAVFNVEPGFIESFTPARDLTFGVSEVVQPHERLVVSAN